MGVLQLNGKTAIESYHHTVSHHALGFDANLIIEGDNLIALKALFPTHAGRIKSIDPHHKHLKRRTHYNDNLTQPQLKEEVGEAVSKKEGEERKKRSLLFEIQKPKNCSSLLLSSGIR